MNSTIGSVWGSSARAGLAALALAMAAAPSWADKKPEVPAGWQKLENLPPVRGLDGKPHTAACSGFPGTNDAFRFWARNGKSKKLVVYFEGGGACWDSLTCTFPIGAGLPDAVPQFFMPAVPPADDPSRYDGIFNSANPANPVKDWDFVYIPYCSGDVHSGSATRTYANVGHPVFPLPGTFDIRHGGFDNFMVVLDWMKKNLGHPEQILVTGSSAGGYGASTNFPWVQKAFPKAKLAVLADAAQSVMTPAWDASTPGRGSWNSQLAPWIFGNDASKFASSTILRIAAEAHPKARVAQFTTNFDGVQIGFYDVMKRFYPPGGACPNVALDWNGQMLSNLQSYASGLRNYRHYVAAGQYHTILRSPLFYTEASAGVPFSDWFAGLVDRRGGDDDDGDDDDDRRKGRASAWQNVACPGCLAAIPCP
ncbi:pectin acetylesterase-family hydrolase [Ideonella sp. A 288]|uniref:pectin acetylesterase-family hydrolase n=1 Tax=Ideonella sp. A 288 TaxID=1962181 RepID=UPI000B4BD75D|nr:pectin acetylesterase-family hydrolase [Ideonella sp. A 288]